MADTGNLIELCAKDDVAEGEVIKVEHGDLELAVYHVANTHKKCHYVAMRGG